MKPAEYISCQWMSFARGSAFLNATAFEAFEPPASKPTEQDKNHKFIDFSG
jgi:hypothetical protein